MFLKSEDIEGKLTHWIGKEFVDKARNGEFEFAGGGLHSKPIGLWLSWDGGWEDWTSSEWPAWMERKVCLQAKLKPGLKLWHIDTFEDFIRVWNEFKTFANIKEENTYMSMISLYDSKKKGIDFWDWLKEKKVDGVALTDSGQWATRMKTWLYGWDAACIVIFNPKNVELS